MGSVPLITASRDGKVSLSERGVFKQKGEFIAASPLVCPSSLNVMAPRGSLFKVNSVCLGYCSRPKLHMTYHVMQPLTEIVMSCM
jgi:hypothetical protein